MKPDTERKRYYTEKLHRRKARLHVHLSKDLRGKLKSKTRAILVREGDTVRIMRGPHRGKEAKVGRVSTVERKVFLEGVSVKTARGKEKALPLEPSNLLLLSLEPTAERKEMFSEDAFRKKEAPKKAEAKAEPAKPETAKPETQAPKHGAPAAGPAHAAHEHKGEAHRHEAAKPQEKPANAR